MCVGYWAAIMINPSRIIIESINRHTPKRFDPPSGQAAMADTHCAACATGISKGEPMVWFVPPSSFTDWQYLTHQTTQNGAMPVCPYCSVFFTGEFLKYQAKASNVVYSADGAWSIGKDGERLWFLTNPPEPPFVSYVQQMMGQHVAWRAGVTLDKNLIKVAIGRSVITIDRPYLFKVSGFCKSLSARLLQEKVISSDPGHPFARLDRKLEANGHGVLRTGVANWMRVNGMADELDELESLPDGILWGLSVLNKHKTEVEACAPIYTKF